MRDEARQPGPGEPGDEASAIPSSRALVRVSQPSTAPGAATPAQADFLTQLIACRHRVGPYRDRRREEPDQAMTCYRRELRTSPAELDLIV